MSTISKRKYKRFDIEALDRIKKETFRFVSDVHKSNPKQLLMSQMFLSKQTRFVSSRMFLYRNQNVLFCLSYSFTKTKTFCFVSSSISNKRVFVSSQLFLYKNKIICFTADERKCLVFHIFFYVTKTLWFRQKSKWHVLIVPKCHVCSYSCTIGCNDNPLMVAKFNS